MRVTFLGTGGSVPTTRRNTSAMTVNEDGELLLFDCGEGTQRQMMRFGTGFGIEHVFLTHLHADHILGLPGLLETLDFNDRTEPLAIHAPRGTRGRIETLVSVTGERPSFPLRIREAEAGDVALQRADYQVRTFETDHRTNALGYALVEDDRKGEFDRVTAEHELGIPPGPKYSRLHEGEPVELSDGRVIQPEQVVGPPRPGRRLVYTGDTLPCERTVEVATDADLLVHDATFASDHVDRAAKTAHSTATQAGEIADRAGAKRLALMHVSTRYAGDTDRLQREARDVFDGDAFVPDDGERHEIPYPESE